MVWAAGSLIGSGLFWGTLLLGRLMSRMERVETQVVEIEHIMDRAGQKMSDLANTVQTMPERFLTRAEAMNWRPGTRAEDRE
jgi:DNA anti-recombination protein RmuC